MTNTKKVLIPLTDLKRDDRFDIGGELCVVQETRITGLQQNTIIIVGVTENSHRLVHVTRKVTDYMEVIQA